jgi:hypothetical protein
VGLITDEVTGFLNLRNSASSTIALGSTQSLTDLSARNLPGGKGRPASKVDNLTTACNFWNLMSHSSTGFQGLLHGEFYLSITSFT